MTSSDPGVNGDDDDDVSSESSVKSSPAKCMDTCPLDQHEKDETQQRGPLPVMFADLFKNQNSSHCDGSCKYFKPKDDAILEIEEDDIDRLEVLWGHCLLGCFAGRFPGLKAVRNLVDKWKTDCEILPHQSGWILFKFHNKTELEKILVGGPYFVYGRTLLLRSIPENFCFQEEDYSIVPTWVQLHNLPLQCWNTRAISRIASKLGKPICVDNITLERKRISYARVLIEMDTSVNPIEDFEVKLPSGIVYTQYIHYENFPKFCNYCFMFGHLRDNCRHLKMPSTDNNKSVNSVEKDSVPPKVPTPTDAEVQDNPLNKMNADTYAPTDAYNLDGSTAPCDTVLALPANGSTAPCDGILDTSSEGVFDPTPPDGAPPSTNGVPDSAAPSSEGAIEADEEGFQTVLRKKNKGKHTTPIQETSLPIALNTRQSLRAGLSKFVPIRNVNKSVLDKSKLREKGVGGAPQSSSTQNK